MMHPRVVVALLALVSLLTPSLLPAAFELDPRIRSGSDGTYRLPGPLRAHARLDATSGECSMAYLSCEPHAPCVGDDGECCPAVIDATTDPFSVGNPFLSGLAGACALVDVDLLSAGECIGGGSDRLAYLFLGESALSGVEGCLACAFGLWGYFMQLVPFPVGCEFPFLGACVGATPTGPGLPLRPLGAFPTDYIATFRGVRDQLLERSARGRRYIELYDARSPGLVRAIPLRPWVMFQIADALPAWIERLTALLAGQGGTVTITQQMVDQALAILAELEGAVDPDTAAAIRAERDALDMPSYVGLTAVAALARFEGTGGAGPSPSCGTGFAGADCALAELQADDLCGADPIDAKLLGLIETRVAKARGFLGRAAQGGKPGKVRKLVRRSAKQLQGLKKKARKASATSAACRSTLDGLIEQRRNLVGALAV